jgi:hypothetical protein
MRSRVATEPERQCDAGAAFAEAVALAFEGDHGGVVDEPVDQGCGDHGVAEDLAPGASAGARQTEAADVGALLDDA